MIFGSILAGGIGKRMGRQDIPKQFIRIDNKPIIIYTVEKLLKIKTLGFLIIAVPSNYKRYFAEILDEFGMGNNSAIIIIDGGRERIDSVENVLNTTLELSRNENDILLVHEAVRPFVSVEILENCIEAANRYGAALAATPATNTLLLSNDENFMNKSIDRRKIFLNQAPDGFKIGLFKDAMQKLTPEERSSITGTAEILCLKGYYPVKIIKGDPKNIKITFESDLVIAEALCKQQKQ